MRNVQHTHNESCVDDRRRKLDCRVERVGAVGEQSSVRMHTSSSRYPRARLLPPLKTSCRVCCVLSAVRCGENVQSTKMTPDSPLST